MLRSDSISPTPPLRLVIVDADRRVRESLASLAGSSQAVDVVGAAAQSGPALELIEAHRPDVVIVDPRLPDVDTGLGLITIIRRRWPDIGLLAMSWSDALEASCRDCGVDGFVPKSDAPNRFVEAIVRAGSKPSSGQAPLRDERRPALPRVATPIQSILRPAARPPETPFPHTTDHPVSPAGGPSSAPPEQH